MKHTRLKIIVLFFLCTFFAVSCGESEMKTEQPVALTAPDIKDVITKLPEAPGYQTFNINCLTCHSSSYVQNQPDLPEKTWTAIVTKMQKTFGAPVSDSSAKEIVQYLVAIKGKKG